MKLFHDIQITKCKHFTLNNTVGKIDNNYVVIVFIQLVAR